MSEESIKEWVRRSHEDSESFWAGEADKFTWFDKWSAVADSSGAEPVWFPGGTTNLCLNALDRHAAGRHRGKAAIIWESADLTKSRVMTYWHLLTDVNLFAGTLKNMGLMPGDRVLIYMPLLPETAIVALACARIGAVPSTIWPGAGIMPLTGRIADLKPRVIVTTDGLKYRGQEVPMKPALDRSIKDSGVRVGNVIVIDRDISKWKAEEMRDINWKEAVEQLGENVVQPAPLKSDAYSSIVYTSGATGKPRGLARRLGGHMAGLSAAMHVAGLAEWDIVFAASDIGSPHGLDDAVFGPLLIGATSVLYEGLPDHPTAGAWWDVVEKHGVTAMIAQTGDLGWLRRFHSKWLSSHDLKGLRRIIVHGEPLYSTVRQWASESIKTSVVEMYRQAQFVSPILTSLPVEESKLVPGPGMSVELLADGGKPADKNAMGRMSLKAPLPPGFASPWPPDSGPLTDEKGCFDASETAQSLDDGGVRVLGRDGEEIKSGDETLGSRIAEEIIISNFVVTEAAVVQADEIIAFVVLKEKVPGTNPLKDEIKQAVASALGEKAAPNKVMFVKALPRTPSGKVLRRVLQAMAAGKSIGDLSSIRNPEVLPIIKDAIKASRL